MNFRTCSSAVVAVGLCVGASQGQTTVDLGASKDNTLYQSSTGTISNGAGSYFFTGLTAGFNTHRGVIEFDIAGSIPAGATIESVTLSLEMSRTASGEFDVGLHRVLLEWGEGTSNASGEEGQGAPVTNGDCTWVHAVYDSGGGSVLWANRGGDFDASPSASTLIYLPGRYEWSSAQMAADVQGWLDDDTSNHGWLIQTDEKAPSSKRFNSKDHSNPSTRPVLTVTYSTGSDCPADLTGEGTLDFFDVLAFLQAFDAMDQVADFVDDDEFNFFDVLAFLQAFTDGCP